MAKDLLIYDCCVSERIGQSIELTKMDENRVKARADYRGHWVINLKKGVDLVKELRPAIEYLNKIKTVYVTIIINDKKQKENILSILVDSLKLGE